MRKSKTPEEFPKDALRAEAEAALLTVPASEVVFGLSAEEALHELQVHQIELEMQNLSLRQAQLELEHSRDQYFDLYEFAPVGYVTVSDKGLIVKLNLTAAAMLGTDRASLRGRRFGGLVVTEDRNLWNAHFFSTFRAEEKQTATVRLTRGDGSTFHAGLDSRAGVREDGETTLRLVLTDVTERVLAEDELRIASIAFESQQGMFLTDAVGTILRANKAFADITGFSVAEVIGRTPKLLNSACHGPDFFRDMFQSLAERGFWQGEVWNRRKSGEIYPIFMTISGVNRADGVLSYYVAAFQDITRDKEADAEIHRLAFFDPLTMLPNRRLLRDRLIQALAFSERSGHRGALIFLDLDNFKALNDTRGHDVGDQLLVEVAGRIKTCIRDEDMVARLGGDEFVVLLGDLSADASEALVQIALVGERIRQSLANPYEIGGGDFRCTASFGVSDFQGQQASVDVLLKNADLAMYQSKSSGRNALHFFEPSMQSRLMARTALELDLRSAIQKSNLSLHYQPQVDAQGKVTGAEALLRWNDPVRGFVGPADFIPLAEETGLILEIGQWVIERACEQLRDWAGRPLTCDLTLAINVSPHQFRQPHFAAGVRRILDQSGADPTRLKIELTESVVVGNVEETIASMQVLQAIGVGFSLDDFGTGYSSLSYLKRLPIEQLKIDRSFVGDVVTDPNDAAIIRTIITMGQTLGLNVIAEGVETEAQRDRLLDDGCTAYQGYLFSRPLPLDAFEAFLDGSRI